MALSSEGSTPALPFPIYRVSASLERYMLYDITIVTWLRKSHHILGVLVGTLPQIPQQNVCLGLPLQLLVEEAAFLVEKGLAYVVLDDERHELALQTPSTEHISAYQQALEQEGIEAAAAADKRKLASKERARNRLNAGAKTLEPAERGRPDEEEEPEQSTESLFGSTPEPPTPSEGPTTGPRDAALEPWTITPTTANDLIVSSSQVRGSPYPTVKPHSYSLFKLLHARGYFMTPGLRFGCRFTVYPGDPLRFHSHFLAIGADWDEEIDLMDLVGGGRLGTGVKKGFLLGGPAPKSLDPEADPAQDGARVFCVEWGGM